jgi:phosphate-selective porin OprO/OprP
MMKKFFAATSILLATTALIAAPSFAAEPESKQVQMLQEQLRQIQAQLDAMKANDAATRAAIAKETAAREASEAMIREYAIESGANVVFAEGKRKLVVGSNPKVVQSGTNRFTFSSADNAWTMGPTGRLHMDFGGYINQSPDGTTGPGTIAGGRLSGGINARRARLGITMRNNNDFTATLILDAGGATDATASINTLSVGYTGIRNTILEAGYFTSFYTLEQSTSSNDIMFIERSSPVNVANSFSAGSARAQAGFRTWEPRWWLGAYMTFSPANTQHALTRRQLGAYQRFVYRPYEQGVDTFLVGVGSSQMYDVPNSGPGTAATFTISERPENRVDPTNLLNTGALGTLANPVTGIQVYNVESAGNFGSFYYQGEYFRYDVDRRGKTTAKLDGAYAQISYTIGGRRNYTANAGSFGGVNPVAPFSPLRGGMGAFELAARVSVTDLIDQYTPTQIGAVGAAGPNFNAVNGGKQTNYTLGLNWYWNSNMLWKFNYIHTDFERVNPRTAAIATPIPLGLKVDALVGRFQVMF